MISISDLVSIRNALILIGKDTDTVFYLIIIDPNSTMRGFFTTEEDNRNIIRELNTALEHFRKINTIGETNEYKLN